MKPPTVSELRSLADAFFAMSDKEDRTDQLIRAALTRWADHIEQKQHQIRYLTRDKALSRKCTTR